MIIPTYIFKTKQKELSIPIYSLVMYINKFFIKVNFLKGDMGPKVFRACDTPMIDLYRLQIAFAMSDADCIYQNMEEIGPDSLADLHVGFVDDSYTISDQYDPILYAYFYKLKQPSLS